MLFMIQRLHLDMANFEEIASNRIEKLNASSQSEVHSLFVKKFCKRWFMKS